MTRYADGRWTPGTSGNVSGCPRDIPALVLEARRLALSYAPRAIETLAALLADEDARVRVAAAEGLLDRAGLRPYSLEPSRYEIAVAAVDPDQLRAALAVRIHALAAAAELPASSVEGSDHLLPQQEGKETPSNGGSCEVGVRDGVRIEAPEPPSEGGEGAS